MIYNKLVEAYFFAPKHVGALDLYQLNTVYYRNGEIGRGDVVDFYMAFDESNLIVKACFKAYGSPYLLAGAELLCRQLEGSSMGSHPQFNYTWIEQQLALPKKYFAVALQIEDSYNQLIRKVKEKLRGT